MRSITDPDLADRPAASYDRLRRTGAATGRSGRGSSGSQRRSRRRPGDAAGDQGRGRPRAPRGVEQVDGQAQRCSVAGPDPAVPSLAGLAAMASGCARRAMSARFGSGRGTRCGIACDGAGVPVLRLMDVAGSPILTFSGRSATGCAIERALIRDGNSTDTLGSRPDPEDQMPPLSSGSTRTSGASSMT